MNPSFLMNTVIALQINHKYLIEQLKTCFVELKTRKSKIRSSSLSIIFSLVGEFFAFSILYVVVREELTVAEVRKGWKSSGNVSMETYWLCRNLNRFI